MDENGNGFSEIGIGPEQRRSVTRGGIEITMVPEGPRPSVMSERKYQSLGQAISIMGAPESIGDVRSLSTESMDEEVWVYESLQGWVVLWVTPARRDLVAGYWEVFPTRVDAYRFYKEYLRG